MTNTGHSRDVTANPSSENPKNIKKPKKRKLKGIKIDRTYTTEEVYEKLGIGDRAFSKLKVHGLLPLGPGQCKQYYGLNIINTMQRMALEELENGEEKAGKW